MLGRGQDKGEQQRQALDRRRADSLHASAQSSMFQSDGEVSTEYLKEITGHELQDGTYDHLQTLLTSDLVLSNISEAEKNELKFLTFLMVRRIKWNHPSRDSYLQGEYRAFLRDDPGDVLEPLSQREIHLIEMASWVVISRIARSQGGWQQDKMNESITRSEVSNDKQQQNGRSWNPFK